jgi:hypothetical protein
MVALTGKALADGLGLPGLGAVPIAQGAGPQVSVQLRQVADLRHGGGPIALQKADPALDTRLLLRPPHQAEAGLEQVVTGQRLIAIVELPLPAGQQMGNHGLGIVPPEFVRHAAKESEGFNQTVQDRLGPFSRQGQGKGAVGVCPGDHQNGNELAALGEIDVDVTEVRFQALARVVVQRDKSLRRAWLLAADIQANPFGPAGVAMFVAEAAEELGGRVPLLPGCLLVGAEQVVNDRLEGIENRWRRGAPRVGFGLGLAEDLPDLAAGVMKQLG